VSHHLYLKDTRRIRALVEEIEVQCGYYERNGEGDEVRFLEIERAASALLKATGRPVRRYRRARG